MIPYNIWIGGYYHMSGGIRALHVLKDELRARGFEAEMTYERLIPESIMVYPEIVEGNPCEYKRFVKWLLNKAEFPGERCWAWEVGCGDHPLLTVPFIELDLWKPVSVKRGGTAYWVGKGQLEPSVIPSGAQEISRSNFPNRAELAEFVANLDLLISFDPFTALTTEAVISNTPVLIHNTYPKWTNDEVRQSRWIDYGIATSPEELDKARENVHLARGHYEQLEKVFAKRIDNFIEVTQSDSWLESDLS